MADALVHTSIEPQNLLEIKDLSLNLDGPEGSIAILKNISMTLQKGECVALIGPSGSGKTSLLTCIAGLQNFTSGHLNIHGTAIETLNEAERAAFRRKTMGIVFQNFHLVPTMTALENVGLPLEISYQTNWHQKAEDTLKAVGLHHRLAHLPAQLSGGEQQRVALARALVHQPSLILADEPTGNLDGKTGEQVIELLFDLVKKQNSSLLLITHDTNLAERCDRKIRLQDGSIVSQIFSGERQSR
jgi:putative ABC transport system ATP-binding protein